MQSLAIVYGAVIDDVLSKVRSEFVQEGNEPVVEELRALWEEKLLQTGVLDAPSPEEYEEPVKEEQKLPQTGPGSLHSPYQFANTGPSLAAPGQLYQQPANVYLASQNYLQQNQHLQQPLRNLSVAQGPSATSHPYQPHVSNQSVNQSTSGFRLQPAVNPYVGQQQAAGQYVYGNGQPHPMQQRTVTDAESRKRKAESTQVPYGADAAGPAQKQERMMSAAYPQPQLSRGPPSIPQQIPPAIPQQDGPGDGPAPAAEAASLDNLSDVEVDEDEIDNKEMLPDFILGQYETVKRIKTRWRCNFNSAVMHLNGQDVVVSKVAGEFTF
ncbi:TPA: hypothetical protein ACH3X3_009259 [Trebouxia sp. C0006]